LLEPPDPAIGESGVCAKEGCEALTVDAAPRENFRFGRKIVDWISVAVDNTAKQLLPNTNGSRLTKKKYFGAETHAPHFAKGHH
jgi:hypothetical protein